VTTGNPKRRSETKPHLAILAWMYGCLVALRNLLFEWRLLPSTKLPGKTLSVGNIAVGGTGKSPVVIALAAEATGRGQRCVILTRGYKGGLGSHWMALQRGKRIAGNAPTTAHPDEAIMQSELLPDVIVVVGAKRSRAASEWLAVCQSLGQRPPDIWILDDGFQHRWLARDFDLVLLDARKPFGALLPRDLFREPVEALSRAHGILFTRSDERFPKAGDWSFVSLMAESAMISKTSFKMEVPRLVYEGDGASAQNSESPASKSFCIVAGIANPTQLLRSIRESSLGTSVGGQSLFKDHQPIELAKLRTDFEACGANAILTTAKDWARSRESLSSLNVPIYVLPLTLRLPEELLAKIFHV